MGNPLGPLGKASKSSLHMMGHYLKASHMCAIVQCHVASLRTYVRTCAHAYIGKMGHRFQLCHQ